MHLQLVDGLTAIERPSDEGALGHSVLVPRERYHHPSVVMPDANLLPVEVHPQRPGTSPKPERPHHGCLRLCHEVRRGEERPDPVGRLLVVADNLDILVEKKRTPFFAYAHCRMNATPMHLVHTPKSVAVVIVIKVPASPHPVVSAANPRLHVVQGKNKPEPPQVLLHVLGHPILIQAVDAHADTSVNNADVHGEVSDIVTTSPVP